MNIQNPIITITMEDGGQMLLELFIDKAPITVNNFVSLVKNGFYNGLQWFRVAQGFVIQSGSPDNLIDTDSDFHIKGEFAANGYDTGLTHSRGAISMARDDNYDSAGTQFFIVHQDAHRLDGKYAAFGLMKKGFDVLDRIAGVPTSSAETYNIPLTPQIIKTITVDSNE